MIHPLSDRRLIQLSVADDTITKYVNEWSGFITDHGAAIDELNGLEPDARRREVELLQSRVPSLLPDSIPSEIIESGMLSKATSSYRDYLVRLSTTWLNNILDSLIATRKPAYQKFFNDTVGMTKDREHLGEYFYIVDKFLLTKEEVTANSFYVMYEVELFEEVILDADHTTVASNDEDIRLTAKIDQLKASYSDALAEMIRKEVDVVYTDMARQYEERSHQVLMRTIGEVLH